MTATQAGRSLRASPAVTIGWVLLLACTTMAAFTPARPADRPERGQLLPGQVRALAPGKLLVAARGLPDPRFAETVVLLADYGREGAMGLIVNRPSGVPLQRGFPQLKKRPGLPDTFFVGGPVAPTGVLALLRSDAAPTDARRLFADVHLITAREPLEQLLSAGTEPGRFRIYLGYAGWGPGQLERETVQGSWHVVPGDGDMVFDPDPESVWPRQIRLTEGLLARIDTSMPAGRMPYAEARSR